MLTNVLRRAATALAVIAFLRGDPRASRQPRVHTRALWVGPGGVIDAAPAHTPGPITLICNGGNPVPFSLAPTVNITYTFNAPVVNGLGTNPQAFVTIDNPSTVPKSLALIPGFLNNAPLLGRALYILALEPCHPTCSIISDRIRRRSTRRLAQT
jgi:hypothetical protein